MSSAGKEQRIKHKRARGNQKVSTKLLGVKFRICKYIYLVANHCSNVLPDKDHARGDGGLSRKVAVVSLRRRKTSSP